MLLSELHGASERITADLDVCSSKNYRSDQYDIFPALDALMQMFVQIAVHTVLLSLNSAVYWPDPKASSVSLYRTPHCSAVPDHQCHTALGSAGSCFASVH